MKYKIGNIEVESIQWKGDNAAQVSLFLPNDYCITSISVGSCREQLAIQSSNTILRPKRGDFLVKIDDDIHVFEEAIFNKLATKVKEPKFEFDDEAYWMSDIGCYDDGDFSVSKVTIKEVEFCRQENCFVYLIETGEEDLDGKLVQIANVRERELCTLEEAIERLKEL